MANEAVQSSVPSVVRAIAILDYISSKREPVTLHLLSTDLGIPKSSTHAICRVLVNEGMLAQNDRGSYTMGMRVVRFAGKHMAAIDLAQVFNRVLDSRGVARWTIQLAVLDGTQVVYLGRRDGTQSISLPSTTGRALPASTTAVGKAMLAELPEDRVRSLYRDDDAALPQNTPQSVRTLEAFIAELRKSRARGYAIDRNETVHGVLGVAAPVWAFGEATPVAAVSIAAVESDPSDATLADFATEIMSLAAAISEAMGAQRSSSIPAVPSGPIAK